MSIFGKIFGHGPGSAVEELPAWPEEEAADSIPAGEELAESVEDLIAETQPRKPEKKSPDVYFVHSSGKKIHTSEYEAYRKALLQKHQLDLRATMKDWQDKLDLKKIREDLAGTKEPAGVGGKPEVAAAVHDDNPDKISRGELENLRHLDPEKVGTKPKKFSPDSKIDLEAAQENLDAERAAHEAAARQAEVKAGQEREAREESARRAQERAAEKAAQAEAIRKNLEAQAAVEAAATEEKKKQAEAKAANERAAAEAAKERAVGEAYGREFGITAADLERIDGFAGLSRGQKLFVLENMRQVALSQVQDESKEEYAAKFKSLAGHDQKFLAKAGAFMENIWLGATQSFGVAKLEKVKAGEVAQGGAEKYGALLRQLTDGMQSGPEVLEKNGRLEMQFIKENNQAPIGKFNDAANDFMRLPKEWGYDEAKPGQKRIFESTRSRYEAARAEALASLADRQGELEACLEMNRAEAKIQLNQFLNQNPDAEAEIIRLGKQNEIWQGLKDLGKGKRLAMIGGAAIRSLTTATIGLVAAPVVGAAIGGWRAGQRAEKSLADKDQAARKGRLDKTEEAKNFVKAEDLENKINFLFNEIDKAGLTPVSNPSAYDNMARLEARVSYTQRKIDSGLVAFGRGGEALNRQYCLVEKLAQAKARLEIARPDLPGQLRIADRLDEFLNFREGRIGAKRSAYVKKEIFKGAAIGAGFALGGYALRHLAGEWFHWKDRPLLSENMKAALGRAQAEPAVAAGLGANEMHNILYGDNREYVPPPSGAPHEEFEVPAVKAAPSGEEIPAAPYQGGHSVWQEADKQLSARFGDKFSGLGEKAQAANVARLQNAIVAHPAAFGLKDNVDFNKMTEADLKGINWDEATKNVFGSRAGLTETVHDLDKTLAEPGGRLVPFSGGTEPAGMEAAAVQPEAANFLESPAMQAKLADLSGKARHLYDSSLDPSGKNRIYGEISELRKSIKEATGGTLVYDPSGSWKVISPDGGTVEIFQSHGPAAINLDKGAALGGRMMTAEEYLAQAKAPVHEVAAEQSLAEASRAGGSSAKPDDLDFAQALGDKSFSAADASVKESAVGAGHPGKVLGKPDHLDFLTAIDDSSPADQPFEPAAAAVEAKNIPAAEEILNPKEIKGPLVGAELGRRLAQKDGLLDLRNVTSISREALEGLRAKTAGLINMTGLKAENMTAETGRGLARLRLGIWVILNDAAERRFEELNSG